VNLTKHAERTVFLRRPTTTDQASVELHFPEYKSLLQLAVTFDFSLGMYKVYIMFCGKNL